MQYNAFHKLPKCRRCLRADDAPGLCRRQDAFRRQRLVTAPQFRNHVRLIEQAAIRYRGHRASQLDRRHTDFLPHGNRPDGDRRPILESP